MTESTTIRWEQDDTGVVTLVLDDPDQSANTMNQAFRDSLAAITDRLEAERDSIRGIIFTSAKKTFFAGGDLNELVALRREDAARFTAHLDHIKTQLRALETLGRPVVAAINGAAVGGGLELALATHHRIAAGVPGTQVGFPEVGLGLLPAAGGVIRTVRILGVAVSDDGKRFATVDVGDVVKLWETATGKELRVWDFKVPYRAEKPYLRGIVFTPDGKYVATANGDSTVYLLSCPELNKTEENEKD